MPKLLKILAILLFIHSALSAQQCNNTFGVTYGTGLPVAANCNSNTNGLQYIRTDSPGGQYFCRCVSGTGTWTLANPLTTASTPPTGATITNSCPLNANGVGTMIPVGWFAVPNLTNTWTIDECVDGNTGQPMLLAPTCTVNATTGTCTAPPSVQPTLTCSPLTLTFPNTNTGQTSASQTVNCSNTSTSGSSVIFSGLTLATGTNFSLASQNCGTISPGGSCSAALTFSPTAAQAYADTLSIASNAQGSPVTVALAGTGQTPTTPTPSSVTISPASPAVGINGTSNESATLVMSDSTTHPSIAAFWNSATTANATVSSSGVVTGVASGTSVISANAGSYVSPNNSEAHAGAGPFTTQVLPAFASPNLSGDRILCAVMWGSATGTVSGIADTAGNTYAAVSGTLEQANSNSVQWWTASGIKAQSSNVITVTWSGGGVAFPDPICLEVQGDTAVDQGAVGTVAAGTSVSTTAITPAQASETIFSAVVTGNFVKAINSGSFCIVAGNSGQTGLSGSCPVSGAGSEVFQQGTFSVSAVTPTATLNASSSAVIASVALKTITGTTTTTVSNGGSVFSLSSPIPAGTNIYPTTPAAIAGISSGPLYNTAIPAGATSFPLQHCYGNTSNCATGDAIAERTATGADNCTFNAADTATTGCGLIIIPKAQSSTDLGHPIYYSNAGTDPYYSMTGSQCSLNNPGLNFKFQCTNNAQFGGSTTDQSIACYDQAQQLFFDGYAFGKGVGFSLGACPGGGHAGTLADPCPIPGISACTANRVGTDPDWGSGNYTVTTPGSYTLGFGSGEQAAGVGLEVRIQELISGNINHAIGIGVPCNQSTLVFPASSVDLVCTGSNGLPLSSNNPIFAGLYWLDYTTSQINAMSLPAWKSALLKAMSTYGFYPIYTIGGQAFTGFQMVNSVESQTAYKAAGQATSPLNTLCSQSQIAICTTGSPSTAIFETDIFNADIPLVQTVNSTSSDPNGHACSSAGGCDWRGHVHLLDPCVAKTMAGQPGGC